MGSGIACHFANIGVEVLLLDICPNELNESEKQKLSLDSKAVKNRIVNEMFNKCIKSKTSPIYSKSFIKRIKLEILMMTSKSKVLIGLLKLW